MSKHPPASAQWIYLDGELRKRGLTTGDLVRGAGVARSCLTVWRNGGSVSVPTARAIAAFFGVSTLEVLVGTRVITEEEARCRPIEVMDETVISDHEMVFELRERLRRRRS